LFFKEGMNSLTQCYNLFRNVRGKAKELLWTLVDFHSNWQTL